MRFKLSDLSGEEAFHKGNPHVSTLAVFLRHFANRAGNAEAWCPRADAPTGMPSLRGMPGLQNVQAGVSAEMPRANASVEKVPRGRHVPKKKAQAKLEQSHFSWKRLGAFSLCRSRAGNPVNN
jgi:hypothetical protein